MPLRPDDFETVSDAELRDFWVRYRDPDVRRLILEVHRARGVMKAAHGEAQSVLYALWEKKSDDAIAVVKGQIDRLMWEQNRLGARGGIIPKNVTR